MMSALPNPFSNSGAPLPAASDTAAVDQFAPQVAAAGTIHEPPTTMEEPRGAPAGSAPNTAAPAGADWEGSFWLVLDEVLAFPPIDLNPPPAFLIRDRVPGWI